MGAWGATGARFYFRTTAGVMVWDATGKVQTVQAGLQGIRPWPSSDGSHITFSSLNAQGNHVVGIIDTTRGANPPPATEARPESAFPSSAPLLCHGDRPRRTT